MCRDQDVGNVAQWEEEQIKYIKEKVIEEGRREDLKKGKAPAQVTLWNNNVIQTFNHWYKEKHLYGLKSYVDR